MSLTTDRSQQKLTLAQFVEQLPDEEGRYELVDGDIVRILATRQHEDIADFIARQFDREIERLNLNYRVSGRIVIRTETKDGIEQGRHPDVSVVDRSVWEFNRSAYSALFEPLQVAVEIVSTNWEDDYVDKLDEYRRLGISEYWIVDYLAIGSRSYLGNPKVPAVFVYLLDDKGVYEQKIYRDSDRIISQTFPDLILTPEKIFNS
jgi:Uma2 family endonuclease